MNQNQTELLRRLDNLVRLGTIAEVDLSAATARVQSGGIITDFLPWATFRAGAAQTWSAPTVGEQCIVLSAGGDFSAGIILPAIYTRNAPSQSPNEHVLKFEDGAQISYDTASGQLSVKDCKVVVVKAAEKIELQAPIVKTSEDMEIGGNLSVKGSITSAGDVTTNGSVTAQGDISAGGISLKSHHHIKQGDGKKTSEAKA